MKINFKIKSFLKSKFIDFFKRISKAERIESINRLINNGTLLIGRKSYGYYNIKVYEYKGSLSRIFIGNYTSIAPDVTIITGGIHPIKTVSQFPLRVEFKLDGAFKDGNPYSKGDIIIGSDVWIGTGVTILSGVSIGDGSIIYNNTLVNKSVPPFSVVGGYPCKVLKDRFSLNQKNELLKIKWWNWPDNKVIDFIDYLTSDDIDQFILKANEIIEKRDY